MGADASERTLNAEPAEFAEKDKQLILRALRALRSTVNRRSRASLQQLHRWSRRGGRRWPYVYCLQPDNGRTVGHVRARGTGRSGSGGQRRIYRLSRGAMGRPVADPAGPSADEMG